MGTGREVYMEIWEGIEERKMVDNIDRWWDKF